MRLAHYSRPSSYTPNHLTPLASCASIRFWPDALKRLRLGFYSVRMVVLAKAYAAAIRISREKNAEGARLNPQDSNMGTRPSIAANYLSAHSAESGFPPTPNTRPLPLKVDRPHIIPHRL